MVDGDEGSGMKDERWIWGCVQKNGEEVDGPMSTGGGDDL